MIILIAIIVGLLFLPEPWNLILIGIAAVLEISLWLFGVRYSRRRRAQVGVQTLVGTTGEAITALTPKGQVKVDGTIWEAQAADGARAGDEVIVKGVDGLTLEVEKAGGS